MKKMKKIVTVILFMIFIISTISYLKIKHTEYLEKSKMEDLKEYKEQIQDVTSQSMQKDTQMESEKFEETVKVEKEEILETKQNDFIEENKLEEGQVLEDYAALYAENSDLYGWLKIADTIIDYPVMYTPQEPQYYLHRNWDKKESKSGLLFADERTNDETENTIIYGHCMKNRTMFGSLKDYKDVNFYEKHKYIEFDTLYEKATYEIVSVSKAIVYYDEEPEGEYLYYKHTELNTSKEFDDYIQNAKKNAYFETGVIAEYGDKLITLSTCDYWTENARLYIVAKKIS